MEEEYRSINENYSVSNYGNVKKQDIVQKPKSMKYNAKSENCYYKVYIDGEYKKIHVLVAKAFIANPLNHPAVDHIDGEPENNNVNNLRWCTHEQNMNNKKKYKNNKSGHTGVSYKSFKQKWQAQINVSKQSYIGLFDTEEEAIKYRKEIAKFDPWNAQNYLGLAQLYKVTNDPQNMLIMVDKILSFASSDPIAEVAKKEFTQNPN